MSYLYGDSTPSTLEVNYVEFLRDAVESCVQVLLADQRVAEGAARTRALETATAAEIARLQKMGALVPKAFEGTPVGDSASATARCVATIIRSAAEAVHAAAGEESANLQAALDRRDAEAVVEREVVVKAIEALLIKHDLPDMTSDTNVSLLSETRYAGRLHVATPFGLHATLELAVPAGHLFERVVRVDRLAERLEVQVPEMSGWLHKEVKLRTQHLEKHHLTAFSNGPAGSTLRLRLGPDGTGPGYDVTFAEGEPIRLVRVDEQQKREEPFEAQEADIPRLRALREKLGEAVGQLARHRTRIVEAKLDGESLQTHSKPTSLVERLIAVLIPETREIAARSQSLGELVLRRSLGGDRREEIFLSVRDLKLKLEPLNEHNRAAFDALFLEEAAPTSRSEPPPPPPPRAEPPARPPTDGSPPRAPTPLYGVTPLIPIPKPIPSAELARATPEGGDAPPRKTASFELRGLERPSAATLDRPPPPPVTGEIGSAPEEKRPEQSGPLSGS